MGENKPNRLRTLTEPFKIKVVEPIKVTTEEYRVKALEKAGYNTFLLSAKDVFIERDIKNPIIKIYFKEDDDTQKIYIEDNAGGIEQSIVDKIFSPYFSTKTNKNGSGLGLYICKTILKRDNLGDIDLKVIDNGTKFIITIN